MSFKIDTMKQIINDFKMNDTNYDHNKLYYDYSLLCSFYYKYINTTNINNLSLPIFIGYLSYNNLIKIISYDSYSFEFI